MSKCEGNCECKCGSEIGTGIKYRTFKIDHKTDEDSVANNGKITVCTNDLGEGSLEVGMAFCSPKDKYNRKYGQIISYNRMESERTKKVIPKWHDELPVHERLKMLALELAGNKDIKWMNDVMSIDIV